MGDVEENWRDCAYNYQSSTLQLLTGLASEHQAEEALYRPPKTRLV